MFTVGEEAILPNLTLLKPALHNRKISRTLPLPLTLPLTRTSEVAGRVGTRISFHWRKFLKCEESGLKNYR